MSIGSIGPAGGLNPSQMASQMAKRMVTEMDGDNDGMISKSELITGLKSKGVSQEEAKKLYGTLDSKGTGKGIDVVV